MKIKFILLAAYSLLMILVTDTFADEKTISKEEFFKYLPETFTQKFCQEEQFFRICYKTTQKKCEEIITSATKICIGQIRSQISPRMVRSMCAPWGAKIGECVGLTYAQKLQSSFIDTDYCNNYLATDK